MNQNIISFLMKPKSTWDCDAQFNPSNLLINLVAFEVILCTQSLSLYIFYVLSNWFSLSLGSPLVHIKSLPFDHLNHMNTK